jgi:F-type H+-transporting ATPase subunit epsilon
MSFFIPSRGGLANSDSPISGSLAQLKPGGVYYDEGGMPRILVVSAGFAEITPEKVLVIARTCERSGDIDQARAQKAQTDLETSLSTMPPEDEKRQKQEEKLTRATKGETPYS